MSTKKTSGIKYFSEESSGFRIQPKTVLIMSLIYIGLVVLLHIWAKVSAPAKPITTDTPTDPKTTESFEEPTTQTEPEVEATADETL
jgi:preprotein translocase subunit Sec61beta